MSKIARPSSVAAISNISRAFTNQRMDGRKFQGNPASDEFGGFYNGLGPKFGMKSVIEKK